MDPGQYPAIVALVKGFVEDEEEMLAAMATTSVPAGSNPCFSQSSEEEDGEEEETLLLAEAAAAAQQEGVRCGPARRGVSKVQGYVSRVVPGYTEEEFLSHFRITRALFEALHDKLAPAYQPPADNPACARLRRPLRDLMFMALKYLSEGGCHRSVGDKFGTSKSGSHSALTTFCQLVTAVCRDEIRWPTGEEMRAITDGFQAIAGLPGVVGAIDSTLIFMDLPSKGTADAYNTYKCRHAVHLMAVCDHRGIFTDAFVGFPGSAHDSRVFRQSPLYEDLANRREELLPENTYMIADCGFPLSASVITPYRDDGSLTASKRRFNVALQKTRVKIEHAFGMLKNKMRKLRHHEMKKMEYVSSVILTSCILHNMCLRAGSDSGEVCSEPNDCRWRAEEVLPQAFHGEQARRAGVVRRQRLTDYLMTRPSP